MKLRRLTHFLLASAAATAVFAFAPRASAQTITLGTAQVERDVKLRDDANKPYWISRQDCIDNDVFHIQLNLDGPFQGYPLEVWVGTSDCTASTARIGSAATCWKVFSASGGSLSISFKINIRAQDIVGRHLPSQSVSGYNSGTVADCDGSDVDSTSPTEVRIQAFLMDTTGTEVKGTGATYTTSYDLKGPAAPSGISAGVGDTMLVLSWDQNTDTDVNGYSFYCDPERGTEPSADATTDATVTASGHYRELDATDEGSAGTGGSGGTAGSAGSAGAAGDAGSAGTDAGTDGAADSSTSDASTTKSCKPNSFLKPGSPPTTVSCGSAGKSDTRGRVTGLKNNQLYAIGVSATDLVGNAGPLSVLTCESPHLIDDFFKIYKQAGGEGGGSFCSIHGPIGKSAPLAALGLLALAAGALVRRRRS